jgi:hypothetical protein
MRWVSMPRSGRDDASTPDAVRISSRVPRDADEPAIPGRHISGVFRMHTGTRHQWIKLEKHQDLRARMMFGYHSNGKCR